jgi:hypothetical protein
MAKAKAKVKKAKAKEPLTIGTLRYYDSSLFFEDESGKWYYEMLRAQQLTSGWDMYFLPQIVINPQGQLVGFYRSSTATIVLNKDLVPKQTIEAIRKNYTHQTVTSVDRQMFWADLGSLFLSCVYRVQNVGCKHFRAQLVDKKPWDEAKCPDCLETVETNLVFGNLMEHIQVINEQLWAYRTFGKKAVINEQPAAE